VVFIAKKESDEIIGKIRKEHVEEVEKLKEGFRLELEELTKDHKAVLNAHRNLVSPDYILLLNNQIFWPQFQELILFWIILCRVPMTYL